MRWEIKLVDDPTCVPIHSEADIVTARERGRELAGQLDFSATEVTFITTAISEVARNIVNYAGRGEISFQLSNQNGKRGLVVSAVDEGPGIADISLALQDGYSTGGSLGLGLPGSKRMMDEFDLVSEIGKGTKVTMKKWLR